VGSDFVDGSLVVSLWNSNPPFDPITMIQWNATKETLFAPVHANRTPENGGLKHSFRDM